MPQAFTVKLFHSSHECGFQFWQLVTGNVSIVWVDILDAISSTRAPEFDFNAHHRIPLTSSSISQHYVLLFAAIIPS